jgi:hypothetical protein
MTYSKEYMEYGYSHPYCELKCCGRPATKPHHIKSRGSGGTDSNSNLISLCSDHHRFGADAVHKGWRTFIIKHSDVAEKFCKAMGEWEDEKICF